MMNQSNYNNMMNQQAINRNNDPVFPFDVEEAQFRHLPQQNFDTPEMRGSMQQILSHNIGEYVVIEFIIGTDRIARKQGILYLVGTSFVTIYDDVSNNFLVCDIFSIKFVYFYYPGQRPQRNYNALPNSNGNT